MQSTMGQPRLNFFCELAADQLEELFADPAVIEHLQALQAGVSLGILDLSAKRAAIVRRLNEAGIPVTAWQLLEKADGYWLNINNGEQALARYLDFQAWTRTHQLRWAAIGLDIEPGISDFQKLLGGKLLSILPTLVLRAFDNHRLLRAYELYGALLHRIRLDGYCIDSYQLPPIVDERLARSTLLQRVFGLINMSVDREVLLLYTSFMGSRGHGVLWSYAPDAQSIGIGSTGGGVEFEGVKQPPPLSWEEFGRDLCTARLWSDDIVIFSLEGCVQQDFLSRLKTFRWDQPIMLPLAKEVEPVERTRRVAQIVLSAGTRPQLPLLVLGGLLITLASFLAIRRIQKRSLR